MTSESERVQRILQDTEQAKPSIRVGDLAYIRPDRVVRDFRPTDDPRDVIKFMGKDHIRYAEGD